MDLKRQQELKDAFDGFFETRLKPVIEDSRRRYRMEMTDADERRKRNLSALPSTKSTSTVDGFVENALLEYHQDPDSVSFTSRSAGNEMKDVAASMLTANFIYRAQNTFPFFTWHKASLKSAAVDGIEAALVSWRRESFERKVGDRYIDPVTEEETPPDVVEAFTGMVEFKKEAVKEEVVVRDTWWIDRLMPGRDIIWDTKVPLLDVNLGSFAGVFLPKTVDEIMELKRSGLLNKQFSRDEVEGHLEATREQSGKSYYSQLNSDPLNVDNGDLNTCDLWCWFDKSGAQWFCQFSLGGELELSSRRPVNDVFFNGRTVNRLPVVVGYFDDHLWTAIGRGIPEIIAPIEDELSDHRNNANDIAKAIAQGGRIRVSPDADVDIDQILNARAFYAQQGEVEFTQYNPGLMEALRMDDSRNQDINELVAVGLASRGKQVAPKGTNKTLGITQMLMQESNSKLGVQLTTRNQTFFIPLLNLIAQLTIAYDTDEEVFRKSAEMAGIAPEKLPEIYDPQTGESILDLGVLDINFDVRINAGMGAIPRTQKAQGIIQIADWRKANGVPTDLNAMARQLNVLAGFAADAFTPTGAPPEPPKPPAEYKLDIKTSLAELLALNPQFGDVLAQRYMEGTMDVKTVAESASLAEAQQNGGGLMTPERASMPTIDGTGDAALGMSAGGAGGYE